MHKILSLFLLLLASFQINAQRVITKTNLSLRAGPTASGQKLDVIPKGTIINLTGCGSAWCQTSYNGNTGYVYKSYVTAGISRQKSAAAKYRGIKYYTNAAGEKVQSPAKYNSPPAGACAECRDGTYSFSRNRRGTCSHHGGVKQWL